MLRTLAVWAGILGTLSGCAGPWVEITWPEPAPLGQEIAAGRLAHAPGSPGVRALAVADEPTGPLALGRALELALLHNPGFAAVSWQVRAAEAATLQAGLRPNPEIEIDLEEFGGTGATSGFGASAITLAFGQEIELGGKLAKRFKVAGHETRLAAWDYEAHRLDLITETRLAFTDVLAAQFKIELAEDTVELGERTLEAMARRLEAGKVSPLETMQAEVDLSMNRVRLGRARRQLRAAREALAGKWGATAPRFEKVDGTFLKLAEIPPLEGVLKSALRNPDIARWADEIALNEEQVALERANGRPNLSVSAGIQRFAETNDAAFVVGVAIPLAVFDRNQGGIAAAEHTLAGAREERKSVEVEVRTALRSSYHELASLREEAIALREKVLPAARRAFDAAQEGYRQGKFGYLDVLSAQSALFETNEEYVEALASYWTALAEVERLTGTPIDHDGRTGVPATKED
jgi:cobalt-zinc-cadmium efflux system outer membrane protein